MTETILVTYGSKYGSTAEIAQRIGEVLTKEGLTADVRPAADVADLAPYDAVVLGSGLYAGRWHRDARRFARRHRRALVRRPVWLFSSGPLDASAAQREIPPTPGVRHIADQVAAHGHVTFGGCLEGDVKGPMARMIVNSGKGGDFRDFEQIAAWATTVAQNLTAESRRH
ncbi:flavodoxin domain-containing protein [Streptomyces sp. ME02-8801-2C]|uniref:flavodoxin domain-containing protein n=1 Tax=Streptomyces sp. ME02-8801-2C TaxID=3028680 RepID=UPI00299FD64D|nr:flavodoxin domain-containing protein [Streptomyces sp. ME02-8801-2C]MDX3458619.1 flavodoxin domain-containing protein [Streptomyces sp. ME02-8801-2C]